jgi:adenylylsulfate kinase
MSKGVSIWLTGLSGSGKTTICRQIEKVLKDRGIRYERLDGDELREHITSDLGFSKQDRIKNIQRVAFVAELLSRNGVIVLASFITPYEEMRNHCRRNITSYLEVYVKCPLEECIRRDVKGLYKKALGGEISQFTGVSDPFEEPGQADLIVETEHESVEESANKIILELESRGYI